MRMRWPAAIVVMVAGSAAAWAEPPGEAPSVNTRSSLEDDGPLLTIDPTLATQLEGLGAMEDAERTVIRLDPRTVLTLEGSWWSNTDDDDNLLPAIDVPGRGWRAGGQLSRELGWATLEVSGLFSQADLQYGALESARHVDLGIGLVRRFQLSRWMRAWIRLGVSQRIWLGDSPTGEASSTTIGISIGTTFR